MLQFEHNEVLTFDEVKNLIKRYPVLDMPNFSTELFLNMFNAMLKFTPHSVKYLDAIVGKYQFLKIPNIQFALLIVNIPNYSFDSFNKNFNELSDFCSTQRPCEERDAETYKKVYNMIIGNLDENKPIPVAKDKVSSQTIESVCKNIIPKSPEALEIEKLKGKIELEIYKNEKKSEVSPKKETVIVNEIQVPQKSSEGVEIEKLKGQLKLANERYKENSEKFSNIIKEKNDKIDFLQERIKIMENNELEIIRAYEKVNQCSRKSFDVQIEAIRANEKVNQCSRKSFDVKAEANNKMNIGGDVLYYC